MKKIIQLIKNGQTYQVGSLNDAEVEVIKANISTNTSNITSLSARVSANESAIGNIYTKTETDTQITNAIAGIDKEIFIFVDSLPTDDIVTNKIYVTPTEGATGEKNQYTEWLYKDGSFEKVGEFKADQDLSNLATKEELNAALAALDKEAYLTIEEYNALETKDATTTYYIYKNVD